MGNLFLASLSLFLFVLTASPTGSDEAPGPSNSTLLWGPYRPNLYVGLRPRLPETVLMGLMWANVDDYESFQDIRHACEQGDDMGGYGWEQYDARLGGKHVVRDKKMGLDLTTNLVKLPELGSDQWVLRVKGQPRADAASSVRTTLIFYIGLEGSGDVSIYSAHGQALEDTGDATVKGYVTGLGNFSVTLKDGSVENTYPEYRHPLADAKGQSKTNFLGVKVLPKNIWQAKEILLQMLSETITKIQQHYAANPPEPALLFALPNAAQPNSNLAYLQRTYEGPFEFDIAYRTTQDLEEHFVPETSYTTKRIREVETAFNDRFDEVFKLRSPFEDQEYKDFGKIIFSNLLGGIGYFHGTSIVDRSYSSSFDEDDESFWESAHAQFSASAGSEEGPTTLFTSVPSRPFFPRGFYWDEGFHLMPIGLWDQDLSLEIIQSWFSLSDEDGWIGREQILGAEARSKVPAEFTTQYPHYANPPTLFIAIDQFLTRLEEEKERYGGSYQSDFGQEHFALKNGTVHNSVYLGDPASAHAFLRSLYPQLKKHFEWFRRTQKGEIKGYDREAFSTKEGYRWRGRTPDHCLTSGIDDYPRARPPHPGELHLDLHCWMGLMTKLLRNIAQQVSEFNDSKELQRIEDGILHNLDDLHWSPESQAYCDQTVDSYEENVAVCHLGYISIFPVLLGLLPPQHPHLGAVLKLIRDEDHLWSAYGLRSLSKLDRYYGTGENYWRGPIWININYLALASLYKNYMFTAGPHQQLAQDIYTELRKNVVNNVKAEYQRTGIIWEQYNPETGSGQRTKAFTGWTSMIVNIMAERY